MSKKNVFAVWALVFLLSMVLLFMLNQGMTISFWITFAFVLMAFCSALLFQCVLVRETRTPSDGFLQLPSILISGIYTVVQIPLCVVFSLCSSVVSWKATLLVHTIILILAWILVLSSLAGNDYIRKINSRQKNHHTEL